MINRYESRVEQLMLSYYNSLPERSRRHYASVESKKLGRGGQSYICKLLNISPKTLRRGDRELSAGLCTGIFSLTQQRISGGGRKKICEVGR